MIPVHILEDKDNPPEDDVWMMLCGTITTIYEDGTTVPKVDFVLRKDAYKADCPGCLQRHDDLQFEEVNGLIRKTLETSKIGT